MEPQPARKSVTTRSAGEPAVSLSERPNDRPCAAEIYDCSAPAAIVIPAARRREHGLTGAERPEMDIDCLAGVIRLPGPPTASTCAERQQERQRRQNADHGQPPEKRDGDVYPVLAAPSIALGSMRRRAVPCLAHGAFVTTRTWNPHSFSPSPDHSARRGLHLL